MIISTKGGRHEATGEFILWTLGVNPWKEPRKLSMGSLRFDRDQRYQTIREIVSRLEPGPGLRVLDVGGGTGELASLLGMDSYWTADPRGSGPNHLRASMDALPVGDSAFDLVIQSDSLEHVPCSMYEPGLGELARTAGRWLIWIGPVDSPETAALEEDLCETHRKAFGGREMDWLVEHRFHGLPPSETVVSVLAGHFDDWVWWRSCRLDRWWSFKKLELALDAAAAWPELEEALNHWYATWGWREDYRIEDPTPAYRGVFVGSKRGPLPPSLADSPKVDGPGFISSCLALSPVLQGLAGGCALGPDGRTGDAALSDHLARIAGILSVGMEGAKSRSFWQRLRGG